MLAAGSALQQEGRKLSQQTNALIFYARDELKMRNPSNI
jgi:hypothetical protein